MGMSILDIAKVELPPVPVIPTGEVKLRIRSAEPREFSSGRDGYFIAFEAPDHPESDGVLHNLCNPKEGDVPKTERLMVEGIQEFVKAFGISSANPEDWVGAEGWAQVKVEEYQGKDKNVIDKFIPAA